MYRLALRLLDVIAVLMLAANLLILGMRVRDLLDGGAEGSYLLARTFSELFVSVLIVAYLVVRYRPHAG